MLFKDKIFNLKFLIIYINNIHYFITIVLHNIMYKYYTIIIIYTTNITIKIFLTLNITINIY